MFNIKEKRNKCLLENKIKCLDDPRDLLNLLWEFLHLLNEVSSHGSSLCRIVSNHSIYEVFSEKKAQVAHAGFVLGMTLKFGPVYLYLQSYGNTGLYHYASLCGTEGKPETLCMTVSLTYIMLYLPTKKWESIIELAPEWININQGNSLSHFVHRESH